ncbi:hypothetical protein BDM02DRAFT_3193285 [Thelephora ganbajun]|uniref:Uncharacterized protein n=1 Tax=Thelephora ganbajun TaxID=370292 RepID=A0ACB6YYD3_THEGA|nr:hypothetical protein BDM02DRAFT_3193285 [Thelephora ganbajun]
MILSSCPMLYVYSPDGQINSFVVINDLVNDDFMDALHGAHVLIHLVSPLAGRKDAKGLLKSAVGGTVNVIRQTAEVGVKHVSFTGSLSAFGEFAEADNTSSYPGTWREHKPRRNLHYQSDISDQYLLGIASK